MFLKKGVSIKNLVPQMVFAVMVVNDWCKENDVECVVTSGDEGRHMAGSLHYEGKALDFRTRDLPAHSKPAMFAEVQERLGSDFDVVLEKTHLHIEWQPA